MTEQGYGSTTLSNSLPATISCGYASRYADPLYYAIKGSEQLQIEAYRKAGVSGNSINCIGRNNKLKDVYIEAAKKMFGNLK